MALPSSTSADGAAREARLLSRLLGLYGEERRIYEEILALSNRQVEVIRDDRGIKELRLILEKKREGLDTVTRLERAEAESIAAWDAGKAGWSLAGRAQLQGALRLIGALIEDILLCEDRNDHLLLAKTRAI